MRISREKCEIYLVRERQSEVFLKSSSKYSMFLLIQKKNHHILLKEQYLI